MVVSPTKGFSLFFIRKAHRIAHGNYPFLYRKLLIAGSLLTPRQDNQLTEYLILMSAATQTAASVKLKPPEKLSLLNPVTG